MPRLIEKVLQTPETLTKERERLLPIERVLNILLHDIDPRYEIRGLTRRQDGAIEYTTTVEFKPEHRARVVELFGLLDQDIEPVVVKYNIPRVLAEKVKQRAHDLHVPASSVISAMLALGRQ